MTLDEIVKWAKRENKNIDPLEFFLAHYENSISRSELAKRDFALYRILSRKDELDKAIPFYNKRAAKYARKLGLSNRKKHRFGKDPLAYYHKHYSGLTRGPLSKLNSSLYDLLREEDKIQYVPLKYEKIDYGNPLEYYNQHYNGMSKSELRHKDSRFYSCLRRSGLLKKIKSYFLPRIFTDPLKEYRLKYSGLSQGQLLRKDPLLYNKLKRYGLLNKIEVRQVRRVIGKDAIAYAKKIHPHMNREIICKNDPTLYRRIIRDGRLNELRGPDLRARNQRYRYGKDMLDYFQEYHRGLTRGQLSRVDTYLYNCLAKKGLIHKIPTRS